MLRSDFRHAPLRASTPDHQHDPEHVQKVRELLSALVEIDHAYEVDLETVRTSDAPIPIKQKVIDTLRQRHQERRAPFVRQLEALQRRMQVAA